MSKIPLVIFAYNRPAHLRRCLSALLECEDIDRVALHVVVDGLREERHRLLREDVIGIIDELLPDNAIKIINNENHGLYHSIRYQVTRLLKKSSQIIVLEDDLVVAPSFITYMLSALNHYESDERVMQVSGYMYEIEKSEEPNNASLIPLTTTWGWATWATAWSKFNELSQTSIDNLLADKARMKEFNLDGVYDFGFLLKQRIARSNESWGILWYATVFSEGGLVSYPPSTLVQNIGQDGSGTHGRGILTNFKGADFEAIGLIEFPSHFDESTFSLVRNAIWRANGGNLGLFKSYINRCLVLASSLFGLVAKR